MINKIKLKCLNIKTTVLDISVNYKERHKNLTSEMSRVDKYIKYQCFTLSNNYNELVTGAYSRSKLIWLIIVKIVMFCGLSLCLFINHPVIRELTLNIADYLGDRTLFGTAFSINTLSCILIETTILYHERTRKLHLAKFLYQIRYNLIKYPLNNYKRSIISLRLSMLQVICKIICVSIVIVIGGVFLKMITMGLYEQFGMIKLISASILYLLVILICIEICGIICMVVLSGYIGSAYLIDKFIDINHRIHLSIIRNNPRQLMKAIVEHNYYEGWVRDINETICLLLFIVYYIDSIALELCIYSVHKHNTTLVGRLIVVPVTIIIYLGAFIISLVLIWIPRSAHRPYRLLLSYMSQTPVLSLKERLKVIAFMERLSPNEPHIGFYCYDLFAMNSYEIFNFY